jgi:hypothetical protein
MKLYIRLIFAAILGLFGANANSLVAGELGDYVQEYQDKSGLASAVREANGVKFGNDIFSRMTKASLDDYFLKNPIDFVLLRDIGKLLKDLPDRRPVLAVYLFDTKYSEADSKQDLLTSAIRKFSLLQNCELLIKAVDAPEQATFVLYYSDLSHVAFKLQASNGEFHFERKSEH